jgi:hypothetical protein
VTNGKGKSMTKIMRNDKRQAWSTPELRRISAGSAEAVKGTGIADGGAGGNDKS